MLSILPASSGGGRRENAPRPRRHRGDRAGRPHGLQRAVDLPAVRDVAAHASTAPTTGPVTVYTLEQARAPQPGADHLARRQQHLLRRHLARRQHLPRQPGDPGKACDVFLEGKPGQAATGIGILASAARGRAGWTGDIRAYDLQTKQRVGKFDTGSGRLPARACVTNTGRVWVSDALARRSGT